MGKGKIRESGSRRPGKVLETPLAEARQKLWSALRPALPLDCSLRRQIPIGPYIVDFACFEVAVVVEVDSADHEPDAARNDYLRARGYEVLRFSIEKSLEETEAVVEAVVFAMSRPASGLPPATGEGDPHQPS